MIPVAPPYQIPDFLSPQETESLFSVIKNHGPWPLINALYFDSAEDYLTVAGGKNPNPNAKLSDYLNPGFRGVMAQDGVCFYDEVHDFYFDKRLIELAKGMHGAEYGLADHLQFNIAGPGHSRDAGHFDGSTWRGLNLNNCPLWLITLMAKSGLFQEYKVKTAQIITYFFESGIDGGFTYWPDGPDRAPQRFAAPFHNTAIVSDNSQMYHRREANGPRELRDYPDLDLHTQLHWGGDGQWVMTNDGAEFARFSDADRRVLFHWTGLVFADRAEVTEYLEHTNDLTLDKAFEIFLADLQGRGIRFTEPSDPLTDREFFALLNATYAMSPDEYPADAPYEPLNA